MIGSAAEVNVGARTLSLLGKIDGDGLNVNPLVTGIIEMQADSKVEEVTLYIDSNGGDVTQGMKLYDMIRISPMPFRGIVFGNAASMAAIVLQACDKRLATKHSRILIHDIKRGGFREQIRLADMERDFENLAKRFLEEFRRDQKVQWELIAKKTGQTVEKVIEVCAQDRFMTPEEALAFGLIDEII